MKPRSDRGLWLIISFRFIYSLYNKSGETFFVFWKPFCILLCITTLSNWRPLAFLPNKETPLPSLPLSLVSIWLFSLPLSKNQILQNLQKLIPHLHLHLHNPHLHLLSFLALLLCKINSSKNHSCCCCGCGPGFQSILPGHRCTTDYMYCERAKT